MSIQQDQRIHHALALYELTVSDGEFVVTQAATDLSFKVSEYSEFKYGRRDRAEQYGAAMAAQLIKHFTLNVMREPIVVIGTPYKRVPNAARMLSSVVERRLRLAGFPSSHETIYQHRLAEGDYGTLPAAARDKRNKNKKRYVDPEDFAGRHVVLIDDVRITGSIERSTLAHFDDIPVLSTTVINLVRLDPEVALKEPHLEDRLNHEAVGDLNDLLILMHQPGQFTLTTRAVKFILQSSPAPLKRFLDHLGPLRAREVYEAVVDEGYDLMPQYHRAFRQIRIASR